MAYRSGLRLAIVMLGATVGCAGNSLQPSPVITGAPITVGVLRYQASITVRHAANPVELAPIVTITNPTDTTVTFTAAGGCPIALRAYATADRSGPPIFDDTPGATHEPCALNALLFILQSGEARTIPPGGPGHAVLPILPSGNYYLSVIVFPNDSTVEIPVGEVTVP